MNLFKWFQPKSATLKEPEFWRQAYPNIFTGSGITITPENAMQVSAVFACVRILAETVASLPLKVYEEVNGERRVADHPLNYILGSSCNGEQTAMEMREFQMTSLGLRGNAYAEIELDGRGRTRAIHPLKPGYVTISRDAAGNLKFDYSEPGNEKVLPVHRVWRVAGLSGDGVTGLSPISLARESIGVAKGAESTAAHMFSNGITTSGTLEYPHKLDADKIENLRSQFADRYAGHGNSHKPMILESGMTWKQVGLNADDAQFLESRKFQIAEIARWYRVPLHMLNELDKATFSNIEHQSMEFVMHTIRPWLVRIEQTANRDLLSSDEKRRYYVQHTVEGLLRGDTKARYEAYGSAITDGWMNRNEVRRLENLNPIDGLDDFLVPMNMTEQGLAKNLAGVLARAEIKALTIESGKQSLESFKDWLPSFYGRHAERLVNELMVPPAVAESYAATRIEEIRRYSSAQDAILAIETTAQTDIEALLQ